MLARRARFTASYASRLNSNARGFMNDMCRCVIITPATLRFGEITPATLRFGEIHHCVPAIPPQ
jgi:hypothetical protein